MKKQVETKIIKVTKPLPERFAKVLKEKKDWKEKVTSGKIITESISAS